MYSDKTKLLQQVFPMQSEVYSVRLRE